MSSSETNAIPSTGWETTSFESDLNTPIIFPGSPIVYSFTVPKTEDDDLFSKYPRNVFTSAKFFNGASNNSFLKVVLSKIFPYNIGEISLDDSEEPPIFIPASDANPFNPEVPDDCPP